MRSWWRISIFFPLFILISVSTLAQAAEESEIRILTRAGSIPGLKWEPTLNLETEKNEEDEDRFFISISGVYEIPDSDLISGAKKLVTTGHEVPHPFTFKMPVTRDRISLKLVSVDAHGTINRAIYELVIPDLPARKEKLLNVRFITSVSFGYSMIEYSEQSRISLSMSAVTAKTSFLYKIVPGRWDLATSAYITALPLASTDPAQTRFLGVNLRLGYILPGISSPWQIALMAGGYYTTMLVSSNLYGFRDMMGPQLFPTIRYEFNSRTNVGLYFKYSPILGASGLLPFDQREIAAGLSFTRIVFGRNPLSFSVDFADLSLSVDSLVVTSRSTSFSIGFGF